MAVQRYKISLLVFEKYFTSERQLTREIFFKHKKRNFVFPSGHVIFLHFRHGLNSTS